MAFSLDNITPGTPEFLLFSGCLALQAVEADVQAPISRDGHIENIRVRLTGAPGAGQQLMIVLRINGQSTGMNVLITGTNTRGNSGVAIQTVQQDDLVNYEVIPSAGCAAVAVKVVAEVHAYC